MKCLIPRVVMVFFVPLASCGLLTTPPLEYEKGSTKVTIAQVVKRVKCDIYNSIDFLRSDPSLEWLQHWSAKVHLTLIVDDLGQLNPGIAITEPLRNAYNIIEGPAALPLTAATTAAPTIGSISQSFTAGLGGGISAEATRQEDLEFFISFEELDEQIKNKPEYKTESLRNDAVLERFDYCKFRDGLQLDGELGLREWIEAAASPADGAKRLLSAGPHGGFKAGDANPMSSSEYEKILKAIDRRQSTKSDNTVAAESAAKRLESDAKLATQKADQFKIAAEALREQLKPSDLSNIEPSELSKKAESLSKLNENLATATVDAQVATKKADDAKQQLEKQENFDEADFYASQAKLYITAAQKVNNDTKKYELLCVGKIGEMVAGIEVTGNNVNDDDASIKKLHDDTDIKQMLSSMKIKYGQLKQAAKDLMKEYKNCPDFYKTETKDKYDPLDLISHQVNFVLTVSGNVTPVWKLARVATPTSPAFAALQGKYTNTLIIAMARPIAGKSTPAQDAQISAAVTAVSLRSVLAPSP